MHKCNTEKTIPKVFLYYVASYPQEVFQIASYLALKGRH